MNHKVCFHPSTWTPCSELFIRWGLPFDVIDGQNQAVNTIIAAESDVFQIIRIITATAESWPRMWKWINLMVNLYPQIQQLGQPDWPDPPDGSLCFILVLLPCLILRLLVWSFSQTFVAI